MRYGFELQGHLGDPLGQALTGPGVYRDAGPAPVVYQQLQGHVRLGLAGRADPLLLAVAGDGFTFHPAAVVLRPHRHGGHLFGRRDDDGVERLYLFVPDAFGVNGARRFHKREREHLHYVVLHDVAQCTRFFVEISAFFDANCLGHRYLDVVDVIARPQWLENRVGEAQSEDVLHGFFAEIMVDTVNLVLVEYLVQGGVELPGCLAVVAKRLFYDQPGGAAVFGVVEPDAPEHARHLRKHVGDGGQVVRCIAPGPERLVRFLQPGGQGGEGGRVGIISRAGTNCS